MILRRWHEWFFKIYSLFQQMHYPYWDKFKGTISFSLLMPLCFIWDSPWIYHSPYWDLQIISICYSITIYSQEIHIYTHISPKHQSLWITETEIYSQGLTTNSAVGWWALLKDIYLVRVFLVDYVGPTKTKSTEYKFSGWSTKTLRARHRKAEHVLILDTKNVQYNLSFVPFVEKSCLCTSILISP